MICARCTRDNKAGRKFCAACGAPLPLPCPVCGFENDAGDAFCGGCGRSLDTAAPPVAAAPPAPSAAARPAPAPAPPEAERRQLTVLFSDLVGSTALSRRLDPEDLRDVIRAYQEACAAEVARWDGFIARYMGDGVLVYFGWPRAHEDDAERAVRAGLAIVTAAAPLGVSVRVGIATGMSVVGEVIGSGAAQEQAVVGETPNLAARLQSLAAPDTVAVSESTLGLLGGLFDTEDLGPRAMKGFDEPVRAYRVVRPRDLASRFDARRARGLAPMVGRERELALLSDRWAAARGGDGQVVLLGSEAGLGKSRLLAAFEEALAAEPHRLVRLQGSAHQQTSPLRPALDWLARAAGLEADDPPAQRLQRLEATVPEAARADRMPLLAELLSIPTDGRWPAPDLPPARKKELALAALVDQMAGTTRDGPAVVLFEDVQWADPSTESLVDRLVDRAATCRCLVVLTFRAGLTPRWAGRPHATQLGLARLTPPQSRALLADLGGDHPLPESVAEAIVARADGVPLFLEELGRGALDSGALAIPATLQESLLARLDRLPGSREVAQAAAVLGREFRVDVLAATMGRAPALVRPALQELVGASLLLDHGDDRYSFRHALVRDAAYESLLRRSRKALHAAAAQALRDRPDVVATQAELVADHLEKGGEPTEALELWRRAAQHAEAQWSYAEAASHLGRAIGLVDIANLDAESAARLVSLRLEQANALRFVERRDEAHEALDAALPVAERFDLAELLSRLHFSRGNLLFWQGRLDECMAAHSRALTDARRSGSTEAETRAQGGLGDAHYGRGAMRSALEAFTRCVELARAHGHRVIEADNLFMVGEAMLWLGQPDGRLAVFERAVALSVELHRPRAEGLSRGGHAAELLELGRTDEALEEVERAVAIARRIGSSGLESSANFQRAQIYDAVGRTDEYLETLERLLGHELVAKYFSPTVRSAIARVRRDRALLRESYERARQSYSSWHMAIPWFLVEHGRAALELGDGESLQRALRGAREYGPPEPMPYISDRLRCFEAVAAVREGRRDEDTSRLIAEALAILARHGHPYTLRSYEEELTRASAA